VSARIHPTAIIEPCVQLGEDVEVGAYSVLGGAPQWRGHPAHPRGRVLIGDGTIIRSHVTIDAPAATPLTHVGRKCYLLHGSHVAHDCLVGDGVTLANHATLGGHTWIDDRAYLGFNASTHPYTTIGGYAMIGCGTPCTHDVPPFVVAYGSPCRWRKLNVVGLRRARFEWLEPAIRDILHRWNRGPIAYGSSVAWTYLTPVFQWYAAGRGRGGRGEARFGGNVNSDLSLQIPGLEVKP